jgi:hypothetical protein
MFWTRKKTLMLALLMLGLSAGTIALRPGTQISPEHVWAEEQPLEKVPTEATVELSGKVLTPDGRPAAGARIGIVTWQKSSFGDGKTRTNAAVDGTFKMSVPRSELALLYTQPNPGVNVIATADGFGVAWRRAVAFLPAEERKLLKEQGLQKSNTSVLRLIADDTLLGGQIKTEDGRPAAGAHVEVQQLWGNDKGDLAPWLAAVGRGANYYQAAETSLNQHLVTGWTPLPFGATTDGEGRFQLKGVGRGRVVILQVSGGNVACTHILARTAPGEKITVNGLSRMGFCSPNPQGCFGNEIALNAPASRPIEGVVTDAESGKPVGGAIVQSYRFAGFNMNELDYLKARTDAAGRFRLEGMPVGEGNLLLVRSSLDQPYLHAAVEVDSSTGTGPVRAAIKMRKGVWVEGQVTDAITGRPLAATIEVFCPKSNPNAAQYPAYRWMLSGILSGKLYRTDGSGRFRVPAIPGRCAIAARLSGTGPEGGVAADTVQGGRTYHPLAKDLKIEGFPEEDQALRDWFTNVLPAMFQPSQFHQIRSLEISPSAKSIRCNLTVP